MEEVKTFVVFEKGGKYPQIYLERELWSQLDVLKKNLI